MKAGAVRPANVPLGPYRVLDLTTELGWLCGKILAELGADVVKIEPPEGDPGRGSLAWLAHNAGKRGITIDLEAADGRTAFLRLAAQADFLVESFAPAHLDRMGMGWKELRSLNPRLVMTSITPYGQRGPQAGALASDLELFAASGAMWLAGDPDRPPVRISLPQAAAWAGVHAAGGTLIAHHHRQRTGRGQHVDTSAQASLLPAVVQAPLFWDMLRQNPMRGGPYLVGRNVQGAPLRNIWCCRDGYVTFSIYGGAAGRQSNRALVDWMDSLGMAPDWLRRLDWDAFDVTNASPEDVRRLEEAMTPFFARLSKREFSEGATQRQILGYVVSSVADIAADEQLMVRDVWQELGGVVHPSGYARFDGAPARPHRPAPGLGEHNREILSEVFVA